MKAIVYTRYGPPDELLLTEIEKPIPVKDELLVKIKAASINSWDWDRVIGSFQGRLGAFRKPVIKILGCDIAGVVEGIGPDVVKFKPGDEVFGDTSAHGWGGFAEYVCASEKAFTLKSHKMTFEEAAATPQAGVMALQGIHDYGQVQEGQHVLLNGSGGGVGTFAIQLAKIEGL